MSDYGEKSRGPGSASTQRANTENVAFAPGGSVQSDREWAQNRIANFFRANGKPVMRKAQGNPDSAKQAPGPSEGKEAAHSDEPVAELDVCADTESVDRTKLTTAELQAAQVGHAWVTLRSNDPKRLPKTLPAPTLGLLNSTGKTAFGFWPLVFRPHMFNIEVARQQYGAQGEDIVHETEARMAAGHTPGVGASQNPNHRGFSKNVFDSWVPGRVEEPDDAHKLKGKMTFKLSGQQVESLMAYVNSKRAAQYSLFFFNCTTFAVEAAKAAGQSAPSGAMFGGVCLPNALYKGILEEQLAGNPAAATTALGKTPEGKAETQPSVGNKR